MPIHLAPLSRRRFLRRSLLAAAGVTLTQGLSAVEPSVDSDFWAFLSDTHLSGNPAAVERGVNMTDHFASVSRDLLNLPRHPAGLFINGDCAFNSGEAADYTALAGLLNPIRKAGIPVHLGLGNHDNRQRFWDAFRSERSAKRPLADRQASLLKTKRVNWFILDSLEKTQSTPGLLGHEQLDWLAKSLDVNASKPALVLVHHNPGLNGGNLGLKDTLLLLNILQPRRQVKAYIFGHTHHWEVQQDDSGLYLVNLPAVAYVFHPGDPSGWVQGTLADEGMTLQLRCVDKTHPANGQVKALKWRT